MNTETHFVALLHKHAKLYCKAARTRRLSMLQENRCQEFSTATVMMRLADRGASRAVRYRFGHRPGNITLETEELNRFLGSDSTED